LELVKAKPHDSTETGKSEVNTQVGRALSTDERAMTFLTAQLAEMNNNFAALREELDRVKATQEAASVAAEVKEEAARVAAEEKEAALEYRLFTVQQEAAEAARNEITSILAYSERTGAINKATAELYSTHQAYHESQLDLQVAREKFDCEEPPKKDKAGPTPGQRRAQIDVNRATAQVGMKLDGLRKARAEIQRLFEEVNTDPSALLQTYHE
jgi:uncharacterized phage infection (PIP) family protein YhgE